MPSYDVNIPGSGTYRVNSPVDLSEQQVWAALQQQLAASSNPLAGKTTAELEGAKSAPFSVSDVITSGAESLVGSLKSLSDVFGAGSDLSNWLGKERQRVADVYTPERKAEKAREAELTRRAAESGSTWEEIKQFGKTVASSPIQSITSGLASSVPAIAAGLVALPEAAPVGLALGVNAISRALFGAAQGVGEAKGSMYDQAFQVYKKQGKSDEEAAKLAEASQAYVAANLPLFVGSAGLGTLDAMTGVESTANKALVRAFSEQAGKRALTKEGVEEAFKQLPQRAAKAPTYLKEAGLGFLEEGGTEALQGGYGQFAQNVAATRAGEETPYMQGVLGSAVQEGLVGGLTGTAMSPLQMGVKRGEYVADQFLRQQKAFFDAQDQAMAEMQEKQRQRAETEQRLGMTQEGKMLALPAPDKRVAEQEDPLAGLKNPVGNIEKSELSPKIVKYVNDYRKANGLPALKSYSIEDIKDAMPGIDPAGEQADLARIIAAKTGFTGEQTYTPEDVLNVAGSKNIETGTPGFTAFLERATGESDLTQMSQPQLYSAFKALDAVPASAAPQILPVDTNASRFKQAQYDAAVQRVNESVSQQPASRATVISDIKDATGLSEDRDAEAILNTALREGVLEENLKPAFQVSDAEGKVVGMFEKEQDAKKAAAKKGYSVQKTSTREIAAPTQAAPEKVRTPLPAGYEIEETEAVTGTEPAGFQVLPEGRNKPLVTENTLEEAKAKVERLQGLRQKAAEGFLQNIERDRNTIANGRAALERMEAAGQSDTEAYKVAKAKQDRSERILSQRIERMLDRIEEYSAPLKTRPSGEKQITRKGFTVKKEGKEVGTFPTRLEAEGSVLAQLSDEELATLASDTRFGGIADRARVEQERRQSPEKGIRVFKSPITPEVRDEAAEALEQKLMPMLRKLGLMDVGLKVVRAIKNDADGSYAGKLVQIALGAKDPVRTLNHEAIHALKELGFFTPSQWAVLERKAKSEWINKYLKGKNAYLGDKVVSRYEAYITPKSQGGQGLNEQGVMEEAIADAFADFAMNKPPAGLMSALMRRLNSFFEALGNAFRGLGFKTANDVFTQVERGELRPQEAKPVAGEKLSLAPDGIPQKIWDLHEKVQQADEEATGRVASGKAPGALKRNQVMAFRRLNQAVMDFVGGDKQKAEDLMVQMNQETSRREEKLSLAPSQKNAWRATPEELQQAVDMYEEDGILPYVSTGRIELPTEPEKFSLQAYNPEKHLSFDPTLGIPINKDGKVTVYYHTTKERAIQIKNTKIIPSDGNDRIYLTNESGGAEILRDRGNFDQVLDGSTILLYVDPSMLQVDANYENGRVDFFVPVTQGEFFNRKMKLQSIQKGRNEPITKEFSYDEHAKKIADAVAKYKNADGAARRKMVADARKLLKKEHNVGSLLSENGKLEKTRIGDYNLQYEGNPVASQGLGLASAQKLSDKVSTCPRSAICEGLCLGETSGGNFMFGGAATEDVGDIQKSSFRAAARMMQYLKTEALIINPEAFTILLQSEIDSLKNWAASETQRKRDPETKKFFNEKKDIYAPAVRLNVTSDFKPEMFRAVIEGNPDVMFYDYTKLGSETIAPNHHLTYSSTGFGQIVDGEKVFFKNKAGNYDHNWATMRKRLDDGFNVAMAFSSKSSLPKFVKDEETGKSYRVLDGDLYDARFLDEVNPAKLEQGGTGVIVGLRNKAGNLSEKNATQKTGGFFVQYNPKDGDTVVAPDQAQFKQLGKTFPIAAEKFSLRATPFDPDSLPKKGSHILPEGTILYHGAYRSVADAIKSANYLMSRPTMKSHGGTLDEGGLVWFGSEQSAQNYAASKADPMAVEFDRKSGIVREPGQVFQAITDRPYKLISRDKVLSKTEAEDLNEALGLPDYKMLEAGDSAELAASRAHNYLNSNVDRYKIRVRGREQEVSAPWPIILKTLKADGFYYGKTVALTAENGIRLSEDGKPMERFSLREAPDTPAFKRWSEAFKRWFGKSKIVDSNGKPLVMYHGLAKDTTDFTRKTARGAPIFLTDDPEFAERFAIDSFDNLVQNIDQYLSEDQIKDGMKKAIDMVKKDYGNDTFGKEIISSIKAGDIQNATLEAKEYIFNALKAKLPTGPHIMPLYVRAERPFDYSNASHVRQVVKWYKDNIGSDYVAAGRGRIIKSSDLSTVLKEGDWGLIENDDIQDAIKSLGFDSFYVKEHGRKNLAVYNPNQVKSATGNIGTYDLANPDVRYSLRGAPDTPEFKQAFGQSKVVNSDGEPMQYYHGTAEDLTEFKPGTANAIMFSPLPSSAEKSATQAKERLREQAFKAMDRDKRVAIIKEEADKALESGDITEAEHNAILAKAKRYAPSISTLPSQIEEQILGNLDNYLLTQEVMYPVYIRAENPFDYQNQSHVDKVYSWMYYNSDWLSKNRTNPERWISQLKGDIMSGRPGAITKVEVQEAIRALGFDAFYVNDAGVKNIGVYSPTQAISSTGNIGTYGIGKVTAERAKAFGLTPDEATRAQERGDMRFSLRDSIDPDIRDAIDITTHSSPRDDSWISRITSAKNNFDYVTFRDKLRAGFLNRYQRLGTYKTEIERRTQATILADSSAEAAALMADDAAGVAASVLGVHDRQGGIPVYKNGYTTVWNDGGKLKGPAVIFAPLAKYGDPYIYQMFQFWAGVQRGKRLMLEGREKLFTEDDIKRADQLEEKYPEFKEIFKEWNTFNKGLVQYMVDTGVVSPENAEIWTRDADYLPFYRALDDDQTIGPKVYQSMAGVTGPKKLKGGQAQLADFLETIVRNTQSAVHAGMRNVAANRAIRDALFLGTATKIEPGQAVNSDSSVKILEKGKAVHYAVTDPLFINAMKSLNMPDIPFLNFISAPANFLRSWVTKDPGFILANLMRDSMSAWVTSGESITPIIDTFKEFGAEVSKRSPELETLMNAGVIGGYDYAKGVKQSGRNLAEELQRRYGPPEPGFKPLKTVKSIWDGLEKLTEASDAATRVAVYKRVMAETGNEAEAIFRAKEIMNFNRKGSNPLIRILTATVPFLNARIQGLDVLYRAGISPSVLKLAGQGVTEKQKELQRAFIARGTTIAALSILYALAVSGDDDYEKQEEETKDNNWIVPGLGFKIPTPFEVGFLFKTVPERFVRAYVNGDDAHQDFIDAMKRGVVSTFAFNPVPQAIKPVFEAAFNFNTFTMRSIVGQGMSDVAPEYQVGPGTTKIAEILGSITGISPLKLDHIYKGYTGTMGTYLSDLIDLSLSQFSDSPKASKRFEQMPVIKRFAVDPEARGNVTAYYKLKDDVDMMVRTTNFLLETAKPEEFEKYLTENAPLLASKDIVRNMDKSMKELRKMRTMVQSAQMSADEKRDTLTAIGQMEDAIAQNAKSIRRMVQESK